MPYWSSVTHMGVMGDRRLANTNDGIEHLNVVVDEIAEIVAQFQEMEASEQTDHHTPSAPAWGILHRD